MFGEPVALVPPLLYMLSQVHGPANRAAGRLSRSHSNKIQHRNRQLMTHGELDVTGAPTMREPIRPAGTSFLLGNFRTAGRKSGRSTTNGCSNRCAGPLLFCYDGGDGERPIHTRYSSPFCVDDCACSEVPASRHSRTGHNTSRPFLRPAFRITHATTFVLCHFAAGALLSNLTCNGCAGVGAINTRSRF